MEGLETKEVKVETKEVVKTFRLAPSEDARLPGQIELAYKLGYIKSQTLQEYMMFCLNCGFTRMKDEYKQRKGIR